MITEQQREERRLGIGGSDAAAVCGAHPYKGPLQVWEEKIFESPPDDDPKSRQRKKMGNLLEPVALDLAQESLGQVIERQHPGAVHRTHPFVRGNFDGVVFTPDGLRVAAVVEAKAIGFREAQRLYGEWRDGEQVITPLVEHVFQVSHYMAILDAPMGYLGYLVCGQDFHLVPVPRDPELEEMILSAEYEFWHRYVVPRVRPPEDRPDRMAAYLARRFPQHDGDALIETQDPEIIALATTVAVKRAQRDAIADEVAEAENRLKDIIGVAPGLDFGPFGKATWKAHMTRRLDLDALRGDAEAWALAKRHEKQTATRPLRVKMKGSSE